MPPEFHLLSNIHKVPRRPFLQISKSLLPLLHPPPYILAPTQPCFQILILELKIPPSSCKFRRQNSSPICGEPLPLDVSLILPDCTRVTAPHAYSRLRIPSVKTLRGHSGHNLLLGCSLVFTAPNARVRRSHPSPAPSCIFTTRAFLTPLSLSPSHGTSARAGLQPRFPRFFYLFPLCSAQSRSHLNRPQGPRPTISVGPAPVPNQ